MPEYDTLRVIRRRHAIGGNVAPVNKPARKSTGLIDAYLGARLRDRRQEIGATQEHVAGAMKVMGHDTWRPATLAALETGKRNLSLRELGDLCYLLGVSLPTLVDRTDPAMPEGLTFMLMTEPSESAPLMASQKMVDEVLRVRQRGRLEVSVMEKITGRTYAQMRDEGFWYEQVLNAANDHYGHDLLTERDKRVAAGEGSKTWVSRRLTDEVGQIPEVAELIRLFDEQQNKKGEGR